MPRPRKPQAAKSPQAEKSNEFVCPECERVFTRAASLGAHRRQAHNIVGAASQARAQTATPPTDAQPTATTAATTRRRRTRASRTTAAQPTPSSSSSNGAVNRDALLQTLFPNGIPAKANVIRSVSNWLDEAERLTRLR